MTGFWGDVCAEAAGDADCRASRLCVCAGSGLLCTEAAPPRPALPPQLWDILDLCRFFLFLAGALSLLSSAHLCAVSGAGSVLCSYVNALSSPETQFSSAGWGGSSHAPRRHLAPQPILPSSPPVPFFHTPPRCRLAQEASVFPSLGPCCWDLSAQVTVTCCPSAHSGQGSRRLCQCLW